jgi:hypothetical protein
LVVDSKVSVFSEQAVAVGVSATVSNTSTSAAVNEGTVTFAIKQGSTTLVSGTSATVAGGAAGTVLSLPAGTSVGSYSIEAVYNQGPNFITSSGTNTLTVGARATTTTAQAASVTFGDGSVTLQATVAAVSSTVNAGTVTFTVKSGGTVIGTATTSGTVSNGQASVTYGLPTGLAAGGYAIEAVYNPTPNFTASNDSKTLTVAARTTSLTLAAQPNPVQYSDSSTLRATITPNSAGGQNVSGSVEFLVAGLSVGSAAVVVDSGAATATLAHTVNRPKGNYPMTARFTSSNTNFTGSDTQAPPPNLEVTRENMTLEHTGMSFVNTTKAGGMATVNVSALVTESADGMLGALRPWKTSPTHLKVRFTIYTTNILTPTVSPCVVPVEQTATQQAAGTGTAGCSFAGMKESVYSVHAELVETTAATGTIPRTPIVDGTGNIYYEAEGETLAVNVVDPGTGFTTGGGWIIDPNTGRKSNFGVTARFLKSGGVQGNSLFIYRRDVDLRAMGVLTAPAGVRGYNFQVKSNAMDSLQQKCTTDAGAEPCWATITGRSNVKAIDRTTGIEYTLGADIIGNQQYFQIDVTDTGEPGSGAVNADGFAIRVWTASGTFYQVGQPRTSLAPPDGTQVKLSGGNVQVRLKR